MDGLCSRCEMLSFHRPTSRYEADQLILHCTNEAHGVSHQCRGWLLCIGREHTASQLREFGCGRKFPSIISRIQSVLITSGDDLAVLSKIGESICKELVKIPQKVDGLLAIPA